MQKKSESIFGNFAKTNVSFRMIAETRESLAKTNKSIDKSIRKAERNQKRIRKTLRKIDQLEEVKDALHEAVGRTIYNMMQDPANIPSGPVEQNDILTLEPKRMQK